jgi:lipopolysaccharide cholinephosphotransferase
MDIKRVQNRLLYMASSIRNVLTAHNIPYFLAYGSLLGAVRHKGFIPWDDDFDFFLFDDSYDEAISYLRAEMPIDLFLEDKESEPLFYHGWARVKDLKTRIEKRISLNTNIYQHQGLGIDLFRLKKMKSDEEKLYRASEHLAYLKRMKSKGIISEDTYNEKAKQVESEVSIEKEKLSSSLNRSTQDIYTFCVIYDDRIFPNDLFPLKEYLFENTTFLGPNNPDPYLKCCYGNYMELPPPEKRRCHYNDVVFLDDEDNH